MKTIPAPLNAQYSADGSTLCHCLLVTRSDGVILGYTTATTAVVVSGQTYVPGLDVSNLVSTATLGVDNLELTIIPDTQLPASDLLTGLWDNAAFYLFECNRLSPTDGILPLKRGQTGVVKFTNDAFKLEFRGLSQFLQQPLGIVTQKTCRAHFADYPTQSLGRCGLSVATYTFTGTVTTVTDAYNFVDTSRTEAADYFTEGIVKFTSGLCAGLQRKVKLYTNGTKTFTLMLPFPFAVNVGDAYSAIAGCQKRWDVDCKAKFNNLPNFQGEPHLPGVDVLLAPPPGIL